MSEHMIILIIGLLYCSGIICLLMIKKRFELIEDKNGYNRISCPKCNSCLYYSRKITYPNGEQYFEFDCSVCNFTGRIRKGNVYE